MAARSYRELDAKKIVETARALRQRIEERFPGSGLGRVAATVLDVSEEAASLSEWLQAPVIWIRALVVVAVVLIGAVALGAIVAIELDSSLGLFSSLSDLLQGLEAAINELVLLGVGVFFLFQWEARFKRRRAIAAIQVLRSLSHIIDMHQLTKDPERIQNAGPSTEASPKRVMNAFELTRYLDYCSELLAILSKLGAIYVQDFDDAATLAAVNEVEDLTSGLSRKIWQKIMILDRIMS